MEDLCMVLCILNRCFDWLLWWNLDLSVFGFVVWNFIFGCIIVEFFVYGIWGLKFGGLFCVDSFLVKLDGFLKFGGKFCGGKVLL